MAQRALYRLPSWCIPICHQWFVFLLELTQTPWLLAILDFLSFTLPLHTSRGHWVTRKALSWRLEASPLLDSILVVLLEVLWKDDGLSHFYTLPMKLVCLGVSKGSRKEPPLSRILAFSCDFGASRLLWKRRLEELHNTLQLKPPYPNGTELSRISEWDWGSFEGGPDQWQLRIQVEASSRCWQADLHWQR